MNQNKKDHSKLTNDPDKEPSFLFVANISLSLFSIAIAIIALFSAR
ncbi:hypothetical protein IWT25_02329 [Secundilactobacillus pentosiphilus]|uniref:Uncharacterized protein n=1 Tax=Secundilactobacillus pentosiphilus TaxID=1714682 RepID=A0A1Z5IZT1_9LACO|nr:hypothetical protein IWT25_02329 [Secundilactobacillus pentosiphilus]